MYMDKRWHYTFVKVQWVDLVLKFYAVLMIGELRGSGLTKELLCQFYIRTSRSYKFRRSTPKMKY